MSPGTSQKPKELYEFGIFRVDAKKETLLRAGEPIPLTPKAFQVLLVLVRHSNEAVSKEDLMKAVWPETFVEEGNLSRNIFTLRRALGESPEDHRYIVTVPGYGYRLAENVRLIPDEQIRIVAASHSRLQVEVKEARPWKWITVGATLLLGIAVATFWLLSHRRAVLGEKDTVVLADFSNSTGDPVFDGTLRQGIAVQLEQSPFLSLISDQRIKHTLGLMGKPADVKLTPELAREVCERAGSAAVLEGSIATLGTQYVLGLRATNCSSGDLLDDEQVQVARKEDVLNALTQIATRFRKRIGESRSTLEQHNTPLAEATTPSLEALEAYSEAWRVHYSAGAASALPLFRRATQIDPNFAMAHAALGRMYADLDQSDLSAQSTTRAWALRDRASDRERFFITAGYQTLVTGNLDEARQTCEVWARTYPRDALPRTQLAGYINKFAGRYEKAASEARKAIELDPDFAIGHYNLAVNQAYLGRLHEAKDTLRRAAERRLEIDEFVMLAYELAFLQSDHDGMDREAARARERSGGENWIASREASALAYSGSLRMARSMTDRAVAAAKQAGQLERAGLWEAGAAVREALFGNAPESRARATAALRLSKDRETEYGAAFALAVAGDRSAARELADDLEKRFPEDTTIQFSYLPVLRTRLALEERDTSKSLEILQQTSPYELGVPKSTISAFFGALYPVYVRGETYLAQGRGAEAAGEFQKILDHRGIIVSDPVGVLARLQLARAFAVSGDKTRARSVYQDFFNLWKNADPDIPVLEQAKAEFAKLE
jgi:DNA-binding winged helix-turn-helix (wHTH) protein/Tfp pilus assembly protein PilF